MVKQLFSVSTKVDVFPKDRERIKNKKRKFEDELIIGKVSNDFHKLYSYFLFKNYGVYLEPPLFGSHITICDGREKLNLERDSEYLKQIQNKQFKVECDPNIYLHWQFYAIRVYSPELDLIRKTLGLSANYPFHITIGKVAEKSKQSSLLLRDIC